MIQLLSSIRVFVVDDSEPSTTYIEGILKKYNCKVACSNSPVEALILLRDATTSIPDIIIVDYEMPLLPGTDFIRALKQIPHLATIPTMILTSRNISQMLLPAIEAGADAFASKDSIHEVIVAQIIALIRTADLRTTRLDLEWRRRMEKIETIFDHLDQGILVVNSEGMVLECNRTSLKILGLTRSQLSQISLFQGPIRFLSSEATEISFGALAPSEAIRTGKVLLDIPITIVCPGEVKRSLICSAVPFSFDKSNNRVAIFSFHEKSS